MGTITGNGTAVKGLGGAAGYGETALPRGDDVFAQADVSAVFQQGFSFGGTTYAATKFFISTDGFVTFGSGVGAMPADPASLSMPFLAIFMADVDTRMDGEAPDSGQIWLDVDAVNDVVTITWDHVGFYRRDASATDTFQMQLFDRGGGAMDVVYRYQSIDWTTGDLQGGIDGLGGTAAFIGYRAAASGAVTALPGSRDGSALLALPTTTGNTGVVGLFVFRIGGSSAPITGSEAADTLSGSSGADVIRALGGDDWIFASGGADVIDGGAGFDVLDLSRAPAGLTLALDGSLTATGWAADLILSGIEGLIGTGFNDRLGGGAGDDWLDGWSGNDSLTGAAGDDSLIGHAGADTLSGGAGMDVMDGGDQPDLLSGGDGGDTLSGGAAVDTLQGGNGNDRLNGGAAGDVLDGGGGRDIADYDGAGKGLRVDLNDPAQNAGWAAGDTLIGIEGVSGSSFADTILGGRGNDSLWGGAGADVLQAGAGNNLVFGGDTKDQISAGDGADTLAGDAGNDTIDAGAGNDLIQGGDGKDLIRGGAGADTVDGGAALDKLDYGLAPEAVVIDLTTPANNQGWAAGDIVTSVEILFGSAFDDAMTGGPAADTLHGGAGADTLAGMAGNNALYGEEGADVLQGGAGRDSLYGGNEADSLTGDASADLLQGGGGNDSLWGGDADDFLFGDGNADLIYGGPGKDSLSGDGGADTLSGGAGADLFLASGLPGEGADLIRDYRGADGDVLQMDIAGLTAADVTLTWAKRAGVGSDSVAEAIITLKSTGEVIWVLQDAASIGGGIWLQSSSSSIPFALT